MIKIIIYCVNYNSYSSLSNFIPSVEEAAEYAVKDNGCQLCIDLCIADNTEENVQAINVNGSNINIKVFPFHKNYGYFGGVQKMMESVSPLDYDYAIISNVDLSLAKDAILKLARLSQDSDTGWIAPQIYSEDEHRDKNPRIPTRYSKRKLQMLKLTFQFPLLHTLHKKTVYRRKEFIQHSPGPVYAGHGSFIILTKKYFEKCGIINYPVFLFCEEIYLGEHCRIQGLKVIYNPEIKIIDSEHVSTGKINNKRFCKFNYDAISYILKTFY